MRKIFLIFLLIVLPCLCVFADTKEQGIVVYTATGSDTVALSVVSSVTHADGFLFINLTGGEKKSYALSSVEWWRIGEVSSLSGQGEGNGSGGNEDDDTVTNRYDVNGDGTVNSADVVCVYNYIIVGELSGLTSSQTDLNEDGSVNSADVVMLYNYILGGDAEKENIVESETATDAICFVAKSGQQYVMPLAQIEKLTFANADGEVSVNVVRSGVASMLLASDIAEVTYCSVVETVCVSYAGDTAAVVNPFVFDGVSLSVSAADVCVTSTSPDEVEYTLDGESENGSFKIYSDKKFQLTLAGLALTNPSGPVINSQSSKKATIKSKAECVNTLTDGTTYVASEEDQKGCVFSEGQLVFKGGGELYVNGNNKHGICSDDYISVENSHITVKSKSDALHANDSVYVGGGTLDLIPGGDGIDCDGDVVVDGGIINCTNTTAGTKAIKSKQNVTLSGGTLTLNASGTLSNENGDISYTTAVKATGDISVGGGEITINNTADGGKGLSADGNIVVSGGILNVTANGKGGVAENTGSNDEDGSDDETAKSYRVYVSLPTSMGFSNAWTKVYLYNSANEQVAQLSSTVSLTPASGGMATTFYYYDFKEPLSETFYFKSADYTSSGGGRPGQGTSGTTYSIVSATFAAPTSGEDVFYSISSSYSTSGTTRTYALDNVTSTYSDASSSGTSSVEGTPFAAAGLTSDANILISGGTVCVENNGTMSKSLKADSTVTVAGGMLTLNPGGDMLVVNNDPSYSSAIKTDNYMGHDGTLVINATGSASRGISTDKSLLIDGGQYTITNTGNGVTSGSESYTAKAFVSDGEVSILDGDITILMSGTGGKGIKVDGTLTIGVSDDKGPSLKVTTTGSSLGSTSGGSFFGGGMGGNTQSSGSSAKAIKALGQAVVNGGTLDVTTSTNGAEGLESKTSIVIAGGRHNFHCYDDCINSSGSISFNGGITVCRADGNDAVDSNAGKAGAITIGNGVVFAYSVAGGAEEGLDCDNNSYIQITGNGIAISAGGAQGGSSSSSLGSAVQGYYVSTSSISYTSGRYYTIADSSGNNLVTYSFPTSVNSSLNVLTATGMKSGSAYTLKYSTSEPGDAETVFNGLYLGSTAVGTTSVLSFTAK